MKTPTYAEIARASSVSQATVSRALANQSCISAATRKRVQAMARKMGWKPNPLMSVHMTHVRSTRQPQYLATLAWIIPFKEEREIAELPGYHQQAFEGAKARAVETGYVLDPIWLHDLEYKGRRLSKLLKHRGIHGVVFYGDELTEAAVEDFDWSGFSVASWGITFPKYKVHHAAYHYLHGIPMAVRRIRELGYRRIAMILSKQQDDLSEHAFFSTFYYERMHQNEHEWLRSLVVQVDDRSVKTKAARDRRWHAEQERIRQWLEANRPDVVIGETIVFNTLEKMGWRVPEDIAIVSPYWSEGWSEIGGIDQRPEVVGANAVDLVSSQLVRNERGIPRMQKYLLNEGRWVDGSSVPSKAIKTDA